MAPAYQGFHYTMQPDFQRMKKKGLLPKTPLLLDTLPRGTGYWLKERKYPQEYEAPLPNEPYQKEIQQFLGLPQEAHAPVVKALGEEHPKSWKENKKFLTLWDELMFGVIRPPTSMDGDISCSLKELTLLCLAFDIKEEDKAYVFDETPLRKMHKKIEENGPELIRGKEAKREFMDARMNTIRQAVRKYWQTRTPLEEYQQGQYQLPVLNISNAIPYERLHIVSRQDVRKMVWNGGELKGKKLIHGMYLEEPRKK